MLNVSQASTQSFVKIQDVQTTLRAAFCVLALPASATGKVLDAIGTLDAFYCCAIPKLPSQNASPKVALPILATSPPTASPHSPTCDASGRDPHHPRSVGSQTDDPMSFFIGDETDNEQGPTENQDNGHAPAEADIGHSISAKTDNGYGSAWQYSLLSDCGHTYGRANA